MKLTPKNFFVPCLLVAGKIVYDDIQGRHYLRTGAENLRRYILRDFTVQASLAPTFPLPENAEYAGQLQCMKPPKRRRMYIAHIYNGATKRLVDAHRNYLCKYKIDPDIDFVYCPAACHLDYVKSTFPECVGLGIQNFYPKDDGNYTGEISLPMARDLGACYAFVGNSHRRMFLGETDRFVVAKIKKVLCHRMKCVIFLCNTSGDSKECTTDIIVKRQMDAILPAIQIEDWDNVIFACEPPPLPEGVHSAEAIQAAQNMCNLVRSKVAAWVGEEIAQRVRILYSGHICHIVAPKYMAQEDIDGAVFCPLYESECFINIINSGLLYDKRKEKLEKAG